MIIKLSCSSLKGVCGVLGYADYITLYWTVGLLRLSCIKASWEGNWEVCYYMF